METSTAKGGQPLDRGSIDYAFQSASADERELTRLRAASRNSLLNQEGQTVHALGDNFRNELRGVFDDMHVLLPAYNQEGTIGRTLGYLTEGIGLSPEQITVASNSVDRTDVIARDFGVDVLQLQDLFDEYIADPDRFMELMQADNMKQLRGKGMNMFLGHLYGFMTGKRKPHELIVQVDTDISNIGADHDKWDPVTYFAWAASQRKNLQAVKAAKNGRNNQPIHIMMNTWPLMGEEGEFYQQKVGVERWPLTGEYGFRGDVASRLRWASGYAVEMVLNMSQADAGLNKYQIEIPEQRIDGQNPLTKETVMYSDIGRATQGIIMTGKKLQDLTLPEIQALNRRLQGRKTYVMDEKDSNPGPAAHPNDVRVVEASRIIPDFNTLAKSELLKNGRTERTFSFVGDARLHTSAE
ncbi:hypothetical protein IT413_05815 [Candidatus Peregrinibacteria bacterium]|nr:hypothetical protein [Candidatus Peregrinibacteria bacterium]